jgi:hypothetical protein
MHFLPARFRNALEEAALSPTPTHEEKSEWARVEKGVLRRLRRQAFVEGGALVFVAGIVKLVRHPDMTGGETLKTLGMGAVLFASLSGIFWLQSSTELKSERTKFIETRRMTRAILDEPDLDEESA